ncbi:unnamed protein product [Brassica oleracea var. botrytis]
MSHRKYLHRRQQWQGFDEAVNGFTDEGWSLIGDSMDDVTITVNSFPDKLMGLKLMFSNGYVFQTNSPVSPLIFFDPTHIYSWVRPCAKASMLLQFMEAIKLEGLGHSLKMQSSQETSSFYK